MAGYRLPAPNIEEALILWRCSVLPEMYHRVSVIPRRMPTWFFMEIDKLMKNKGQRIAKITSEERIKKQKMTVTK